MPRARADWSFSFYTMADEPVKNETQETTQTTAPEKAPAGQAAAAPTTRTSSQSDKETAGTGAGDRRAGGRSQRRPGRAGGGRSGRAGRDRGQRQDRTPEFAQKIIGIRRVTRVMAGGRRFSFSVAMVIGDKKGRVGVGVGKAGDTALAIEKAIRDARKNLFVVSRTESNSIPHNVEAKYGSTELELRPAQGRGLVAGASARTVLELGGVTDVTAKVLSRSKNKINIARATIHALKKLEK